MRGEIQALESQRGGAPKQPWWVKEASEIQINSKLQPEDELNELISDIIWEREYSGPWDPLPGFKSGLCHYLWTLVKLVIFLCLNFLLV